MCIPPTDTAQKTSSPAEHIPLRESPLKDGLSRSAARPAISSPRYDKRRAGSRVLASRRADPLRLVYKIAVPSLERRSEHRPERRGKNACGNLPRISHCMLWRPQPSWGFSWEPESESGGRAVHKEKSIGAVLSETKEELKEIFQTRVQILKTEFQEKVHTWKRCVPSLAAAAILIVTSWFTLTFTLVALVQAWFASGPYTWFL